MLLYCSRWSSIYDKSPAYYSPLIFQHFIAVWTNGIIARWIYKVDWHRSGYKGDLERVVNDRTNALDMSC